ncbi:MAG: ATP-dependent Clp protease protease subunit [Hyphomonas sp.]
MNQIFADATGKSLEQIKKDTDRDFWMSAEEAVKYGLVNKIVTNQGEIK